MLQHLIFLGCKKSSEAFPSREISFTSWQIPFSFLLPSPASLSVQMLCTMWLWFRRREQGVPVLSDLQSYFPLSTSCMKKRAALTMVFSLWGKRSTGKREFHKSVVSFSEQQKYKLFQKVLSWEAELHFPYSFGASFIPFVSVCVKVKGRLYLVFFLQDEAVFQPARCMYV